MANKLFTSRLHFIVAANILGLLLIVLPARVFAQTMQSTSTDLWATAGTWSPAGPPVSPTNNAEILSPHNVTIANGVNATVVNLTVRQGATLTLSGTGTLTVTGNLVVEGTINAGGTGAINVTGPITIASTGQFNITSSSMLTLSGNLTNNGVFNKSGNGATTINAAISFSDPGPNHLLFTGAMTLNNDLTIPNATDSVSITGNVTIVANRILQASGALRIGGTLNGGNSSSRFELTANARLHFMGATAPMATGLFVVNASGCLVNYGLTGNQTVRSAEYHHLQVSGSNTKTLPTSTLQLNGSFTRSGSATISQTNPGSITFQGNSPAFLNLNGASPTFWNLIVNKSGSSLTLVPGAVSLSTTATFLNITAGTLHMGSTQHRVIVNGSLLASTGSFDMSGASGHILRLLGFTNQLNSLVTSPALPSTVEYHTASAGASQQIFGSPNYRTITLTGVSTFKQLQGNVAVSGTLSIPNDLQLSLGDFDLKLSSAATLSGAFTASRMIVTDGTGAFIKEFTSIANLTTQIPGGTFPVGNRIGSKYSPFQILSPTGSITGTATISVRAIATKQPNIPYFNNAAIKYWDVQTTNLTLTSANIRYTFSTSPVNEIIGIQANYQPVCWNGSALVTPGTLFAPGSNPTGFNGVSSLNGQWTAYDPTVVTTLYSYQSGDWANANTWTTDPSGSTLVNSIIPSANNQVVILPGRTVFSTSTRNVASMQIQSGAILDLGTTTGNNFQVCSGQGTLRISSSTAAVPFPTGSFSGLLWSNGGTVEYYNLPASATLPTIDDYHNLSITNSTATAFSATSTLRFRCTGSFRLSQTGGAAANLNIDVPAGAWDNYRFNGDIEIGTGCTMQVLTTSRACTITLEGGSLNVNGRLITQANAAYSTNTSGTARLEFIGNTNSTATFNSSALGPHNLSTIWAAKPPGYEVYMSASPAATVNFWGTGNIINVTDGTLRLGPNLVVDRLSGSPGVWALGSSFSSDVVLWIDGATVNDGINTSYIQIFGNLRITAGVFNCTSNDRAIVLSESGFLQIDGGTVNTGLLRTPNFNALIPQRGSFVMNGGVFNLDGNSGFGNNYPIFSLPYSGNIFRMSGGTINITRSAGTNSGGILVASSALNSIVTGGQVNVNLTGGSSFDISCTAPLWNLTFNKPLAGLANTPSLSSITFNDGSSKTQPAQPLVVLNNLDFLGSNAYTFNANGNNLTVGGNMTIASGVTYTSGSNTLIFNGNAAQTFTQGGTFTGNNLNISKGLASTLTFGGSAASFSFAGNLDLLTGTLNDGGKTLNFAGNLTNNGIHSGSGKIVMNGTVLRTIGGNGNGVFQNLELSPTSGAVGSVAITATNTLRVNGNLNFTTDRLLSLGNNRLLLQASTNVTSSSGSFGTNRYIQSGGFLSDGGIVKPFDSGTGAFLFPFGTTAGGYTPATIQFNSAPTTWGTLDVRPVAAKQLYVTDPNALNYYWKVKTTGFSGVPANSISYTFNYGNLPDNTTYIPGYYDFQTIAYTSFNDVNLVDEANNTIVFSNVGFLDGDYTSGVPAAFGIVVPYYSRTNGNWNSPSTWSNTGHGGAPSATVPNASVPVFVGNGTSFFHTVTVTANNALSGSLIIDAGSTLDLGTTTGHNFGALPFATAGGAGRLRISSSAPTAEFPAGDFGIFFTLDGGIAEYYSGASNFTIPTVTAGSIPILTYRNLVLNPSASASVTLPDANLEIFEHLQINGNAAGVANLNSASSRTLKVNGNLQVNSGLLRFRNNAANIQTIDVLGDISVANGGTFAVENTLALVHQINLSGNLVNNGIVDFNQSSDVNLNFTGNTNVALSGTNGAATANLGIVTLNKGIGQSAVLNVDVAGSLTTPGNGWLNLVNGTFRLSKATTLTLSDQAESFTIPQTACFSNNNAGAVVNVGWADAHNADLLLVGKLELLAGTFNVGNPANNRHNDLEYPAQEIAEILVDNNATLNVNGQIKRSGLNTLGSLTYTQRGNSTVLVRGKNNDASGNPNLERAKFELDNNSSFTMEGNALLIIDRSGLASAWNGFGDVYINPLTASLTGGEIRIGTENTANAEVFMFFVADPLYNLSIDGTTTTKILSLQGWPLVVKNNLSINGNSSFRANGLNLTIGGNFLNENTTSTPGFSNGGFQPVLFNQTTTFNGSTGSQFISGVAGNLTNFAHVVFNNTFGGGSINLNPNTNIYINRTTQIQGNNLNGGANTITALGNVTNSEVVTSSAGGFFVLAGTSPQTINGNGSGGFGNLRLNNVGGAEITAPITINGELNLANGIFYINNHLLTLGENSSVTGSFNMDNMIRTNGVLSDGGVRKLFGPGSANFTWPFGVTFKYTPASVLLTGIAIPGFINMKVINTRHPATSDPLNKELTYYWNVSSGGLNAATASQNFTYLQSDAVNGIESNYRGGIFNGAFWDPAFGIPASVNPSTNVISLNGTASLNGDITAGESTEFNQLVVFYSRNATSGGNWNDLNAWSTDPVLQHAGPAATAAPSSNTIVIAAGHTITATVNGYNAPIATINGTLQINSTFGHNFGTVSGNGSIRLSNVGANFIFPGGNYSTFVDAGGGTFDYNANVTAQLPLQTTYCGLRFSGTGTKNLPNTDLLVNGDYTISQGVVNNGFNRNTTLLGNWANSTGTSGYASGTGLFTLSGFNQNLTGGTQFGFLEVNGGGVKSLNSSVIITSELRLISGIVQTGANLLTINASGSVIGGSPSSYVNGNLQKGIPASTVSSQFEVGDENRYAPLTVGFLGSTIAGGFITASTTSGDHPNISSSDFNSNKTVNRFFSLVNSGVFGFTSLNLTFQFNAADLDGAANFANFKVGRLLTGNWTYPTVVNTSASSITVSGINSLGEFQIGEGKLIWTGNISSNWNTTGNWNFDAVPTSSDNIEIGNGPNMPSFLSPGDGYCKDILFQPGTSLTVPTGYTLHVAGNWTGDNTVVSGAGTVRFSSAFANYAGNTTFPAEVSVATGANLNLGNSTAIMNDIAINNGASLTVESGGVLDLYGTFTNDGSASLGAGTIRFVGTVQQQIGGTTESQFESLELNNSAADDALTLLTGISVSGNLIMTDGNLQINDKDIQLGSTGTVVNETNDKLILGTSGEVKRNITLAASTAYNNIGGLGIDLITGAVAPGPTLIERGHASQAVSSNNSVRRYYDIEPTVNTGLNATLRIGYFDNDLTDIDGIDPSENQLIPWRSEDEGLTWEGQHFPNRISNDAAANWVQLTQISAFSRWTLSDWISEPLPIELLGFTATANYPKMQVDIQWQTASETNNNFFTVQKSLNAIDFVDVFNQNGAGNSNSIKSYSGIDPSPHHGVSYYRLRQTDYNGTFTFSEIVPIVFDVTQSTVANFSVNQENNIHVTFTGSDAGDFNLNLFDASGKLVLSERFQKLRAVNQHQIYNPGLKSGMYFVKMEGAGKTQTGKLFIQ